MQTQNKNNDNLVKESCCFQPSSCRGRLEDEVEVEVAVDHPGHHPSFLSPWRLLPPAQTESVDPWCRLPWADQNSRPKELAVVRAPLGVIPPGQAWQGRDSAISQGPMPKAALQWEGARGF